MATSGLGDPNDLAVINLSDGLRLVVGRLHGHVRLRLEADKRVRRTTAARAADEQEGDWRLVATMSLTMKQAQHLEVAVRAARMPTV